MTDIPQNIKDRFFNMLLGEISIEDFEIWVYNSTDLESYLSSDEYTDLISLDYKNKGTKYEIQHLISRHIEKSEFETWRIKILLQSALNRTGDFVLAIRLFYDLYSLGYEFMDNLGLGYGLALECPYSSFGVDSFDELTDEQRNDLVNGFYPEIQSEIMKVLNWIDSGTIKLSGNQDENNCFKYIDNRSEFEKSPTTYRIEKKSDSVNKVEWWKIWN